MQRIRIFYKKGELLQYTGNLDLHKVWERIFRRAQLPLAYSQGFHPQPRIHQACPLPLGFTSSAELLDFWCDSEESLEEIQTQLIKALHPGIVITRLESIPLKEPALQTIVAESEYLVKLTGDEDISSLEKKISEILNLDHMIRTRRDKEYDLRPLIKALSLNQSTPPGISMKLSVLPGATGRPEEVLDALSISIFDVDVERTALLF